MLFSTIKPLLAPFFSLTILITGHGLFATLVPIKLNAAGFEVWIIGLIASSYYIGLVLGSFRIEHLVIRVGHIRAYSALAATATTIPLLMNLCLNPYYWCCLRLIYGYAIAGLFVVIESWFLSASQDETRGQLLSMYMIAYFGASAAGQYFLKLESYLVDSGLLECVSLLVVLSMIPLAITRTASPAITTAKTMRLRELFVISQSAMIGAFSGGIFTAIVLSLFPVYIVKNHHPELVSYLMAITILGGMLFQYPVGKLSDQFDRRKILLGMFAATGVCSLLCFIQNVITIHYKEIFFFIIGGTAATIYPISINLMADNVEDQKIISATQGMLLFYSVGCVVGPTLAPIFQKNETQTGIFLFMTMISFISILLISIKVICYKAVPMELKQQYVPSPPVQTSTMTELTQSTDGKEDSIYEQC